MTDERKHHPAEGLQFDKQLDDLCAAAEEAIKIIEAEGYKPSAEQLLAEAVKVIGWYANRENHKHYGFVNDDGFNWSKAHIDEGQRARDFLAKLGR